MNWLDPDTLDWIVHRVWDRPAAQRRLVFTLSGLQHPTDAPVLLVRDDVQWIFIGPAPHYTFRKLDLSDFLLSRAQGARAVDTQIAYALSYHEDTRP